MKENAIEKLLELTRGKGVDIAFEVVGNPSTFELAVYAVKYGGNAVYGGASTPNRFRSRRYHQNSSKKNLNY